MPDPFHVHALPAHDHAHEPEPLLRFSIAEGDVANEFLRQGPVAAHMLLSSGSAARLIVAFPAGNSALGLWCAPGDVPCQWDAIDDLHPVQGRDSAGRPLYGVRGQVALHGGALRVRTVVLSSARVLRDFQSAGMLPDAVAPAMGHDGATVHWSRDRLDGGAGYALALRVDGGSVVVDSTGRGDGTDHTGHTDHTDGTDRNSGSDAGHVTLLPGSDGVLRLTITALCGETPLTPMPLAQLLRAPDAGDARTRNSLAFLSYEEKLLAGSWRFNTYFGRDTLMSLALLMPALTPRALEAAFGAVLSRLGANGDVAHEEDIGECALLHPQAGAHPVDTPICDYKMVDDDFMLAPVIGAYLASCSPAQAQAFLARRTGAGLAYRTLLIRNCTLVLEKAAPFARSPHWQQLIALKPGQITGDWRDSSDGLGGGVYSYNVNAVLVPAALRAIALLSDVLAARFDDAAPMAAQWEAHASALFHVERSADAARSAVALHAAELGLDAQAALDSLADAAHRFHAVALDAHGVPVPVLHSDFGFALLLQTPPAAEIERELAAMMRPFPAGLMTGVGLLVANGAFGPPALRAMFGPDRYHGAVVWSWQQALLASGLARQRARTDLPASTQQALAAADTVLWQAIGATRAQGNSELWSWQVRDGRFHMLPFGPGCATADESNAAQLWSTVYLAVRAPGAV